MEQDADSSGTKTSGQLSEIKNSLPIQFQRPIRNFLSLATNEPLLKLVRRGEEAVGALCAIPVGIRSLGMNKPHPRLLPTHAKYYFSNLNF